MPKHNPATEAKNQLQTTNSAAAGYGTSAGSELGPLSDTAQNLVNSKGYDPATLSAITNAGMGANNAAFGSAAGQIQRDAARTKNPAGTAGSLDTLARDKGIAGGTEAGNIQIANQNFKNQQQGQGLNLLNSLYGTNTTQQRDLLGQGVPAISAQNAANLEPFQAFNDVLTGIGSIIPGKKG